MGWPRLEVQLRVPTAVTAKSVLCWLSFRPNCGLRAPTSISSVSGML